MNFDLTAQQRAFQDVVRQYLSDMAPRQKLIAALDDPALGFEVFHGLAKLGVFGLMTPEAYGGSGLELLDMAAVAEAAGWSGAPGPFAEHIVATAAIAWSEDDTLKAKWLPKLVCGEARATVALAGADGAWANGDERHLHGTTVSGVWDYVPWAEGADLMVIALADGALGLIDLSAGARFEALNTFDGTRRLHRVSLDEAAMIVLTGEGLAARLRDMWLVLLAADACGGAAHCLEATTAYVKERVQFGSPIGRFQGVKHQLADLALYVDPLPGLYWYAAHVFDHEPDQAAYAAAVAKAHACDTYVTAARRAIELHGGIAYTWEHGAHIWLRRALHDRQFLGTPARHRARIADLLGW